MSVARADALRLPARRELRSRHRRRRARSSRRPRAPQIGAARGRGPRRRAPPRAALASNSPTTVGPEPLTSDARLRASRAARAPRRSRHERERGVLEIVVQQLSAAGSAAPSSRTRGAAASARSVRARACARARAGRPARTPPRSTASPARAARAAEQRLASGSGVEPLAGAASPASARETPAPARRRRVRAELAQQLLVAEPRGVPRQPQRRGRVGRAAAEPGRDRDALDDRQPQRRAVPAGARAERRERRAARFSCAGPGTPGADDLVLARRRPERARA